MKKHSCSTLILVSLLCISGCRGGMSVRGAGATFPDPLYQDMIQRFRELYPNISITYEAVGSGEGVNRLLEGKIDFAGSDVRLTQDQMQLARTGPLKAEVLQIPATVGAVAPIYNRVGIANTLHFTPAALAGIFSGNIRYWDEEPIQRANLGTVLPHHKITVIYRSDGSGTTCIFSEFLAATEPTVWHPISLRSGSNRGIGCRFEWPSGSVGAEGSANLIEAVRTNEYSIGYVEYSYADETDEDGVDWGYVRNGSGNFERARIENIRAAMTALKTVPEGSLLAANAKGAYPISAVTWLLMPMPLHRDSKQQLCKFLDWMLEEGQKRARGLGYVELPREVIQQEHASINDACS